LAAIPRANSTQDVINLVAPFIWVCLASLWLELKMPAQTNLEATPRRAIQPPCLAEGAIVRLTSTFLDPKKDNPSYAAGRNVERHCCFYCCFKPGGKPGKELLERQHTAAPFMGVVDSSLA
jgi:hypothetical protein